MEYPLIIILALTMSSKEPDFNRFVVQQEEAFESWRESNPGDFKAYLDAKVLEFSKPKDLKVLKKQVFLIALYKFKKEPPSSILKEVSEKYRDVLEGLDMSKVTWQELFDKIRSLNQPNVKDKARHH
jgi:hypothetical protein